MRNSVTVKNTEYEIGGKFASGGQATIFRVKDNPMLLIKEYCPSFAERDINGILSARSEIWKYRLQNYVDEISAAEKRATAFCMASHQSQFCSWEFDPEHMTAVMRKAPSDCKTLMDVLIEWESKPLSKSNDESSDLQRVRKSVEIIHSVLSAVDSLHQAHLLHLDLTPGNIIWGENSSAGAGTAYLIDLACNQLIGTPASKCRESSPGYTAPEVLRGGNTALTEAADLYSIGALLLLLCCGRNAVTSNWEVRKLPGQGNINVIDPVSNLEIPLGIKEKLIQIVIKATTRRSEYYGMIPRENSLLRPAEVMLSDLLELEALCRPMEFPLQHRLPAVLGAGRFIQRTDESNLLTQYLQQGQKVIHIQGDGGLGKTEFIIAYATQAPMYNWHYTTFKDNIRSTVLGLDFTGWTAEKISRIGRREVMTLEEQYESKLRLLSRYGSDTVLIIDNFDGDPKKLAEDPARKQLEDLDLRIVYTTRNHVLGNCGVEIKPFSTETLVDLVRFYLKDKYAKYDHDDIRALIEQVQNNTLVVDIIARLLKKTIRLVNTKSLLQDLRKDSWTENLLEKNVVSDYNHETASRTALGHLLTLFNTSNLSADECFVMSCACMIPASGVDTVLFAECVGQDDEVIENLIETGWLKPDELNDFIAIHPLIRTACLYSASTKPNWPDIEFFWKNILGYTCNGSEQQKQIHSILLSLLKWFECSIPPKLYAKTQNTLVNAEYFLCEYTAAMDRGKMLLDYLEQKLPDEHSIAVDTCETLGIISNLFSMTSAFIRYFEEAIRHQQLLPDDPETLAGLYIKLARAYMEDCAIVLSSVFDAEEFLDTAQKLLPEKSILRADYFDARGLLCIEQKKFLQAYDYFSTALEIRKEMLIADSKAFSCSHSYLGQLLMDMHRYPEAINELESALRYQKQYESNDLNLAMNHYNLGSCWFIVKDYHNALRCYRDALIIYNAALPENHPDLADLNCRVGVCYAKIQNWDQCLKHLNGAINIAESAELANDMWRDPVYSASISRIWGKLSIECLGDLRRTSYETLSDYDIQVIELCYLVGRYHQFIENWQGCQHLYTRALLNHDIACLADAKFTQDQQLVFELHLRLGSIYFRLADMVRQKQRKEMYVHIALDDVNCNVHIMHSLKHFKEAFSHMKEKRLPMTLRIVKLLSEYGECHEIAENWDEAANIYAYLSTYDIPDQCTLRLSMRYALLYRKMIHCFRRTGRWQDGINAFLQYKSYVVEEDYPPFFDYSIEALYLDTGLAYYNLHQPEKAQSCLLKSEQLWPDKKSRNADLYQLYETLSRIYADMGDAPKSLYYSNLAKNVL